MKPDGGSAFPYHYGEFNAEQNKDEDIIVEGMSLRDWFAGMALQGILTAHSPHIMLQEGRKADSFALQAYSVADAMIAEREREEHESG